MDSGPPSNLTGVDHPPMQVQRLKNTTSEKRGLIIDALFTHGMTITKAASFFSVAKSTISRIKKAYEQDGRREAKKKGGNRPKLLTTEDMETIIVWIDDDCTRTLAQLRAMCIQHFHVSPSNTTLSRVFKEFHYSLKRITLQPAQRNSPETIRKRIEYAREYLGIMSSRESMYFIDESGFSCSMRRSKGRSLAGTPAVATVPSLRTKNYSLCAAYNINSMIMFEVRDRAYNTEYYLEFIGRLIEVFQQFDIMNAIIIADNVPFHHAQVVVNTIEVHGHRMLFLPPYSPFLNPIENVFSEWKSLVRAANPQNETELLQEIQQGAFSISPEHCRAYFRHMENYIGRCLNGEEIED
jgi:transposase